MTATAHPTTPARDEPTETEVDLTVVLPVHNGEATIRQQLDALVASRWTGTWEVLVVDNRSTDATPEIVAGYVLGNDRVRVVQAIDHAGLSYARNVGVQQARGRAVAFCDDDDLVDPAWVAAMGDALRDHPVVASHMVYETLSSAAALDGRANFQGKKIERMFGLPIVNGASGWQRSLWVELGGNDESMRTTGEDFDMALRAHLEQGAEPYFAETAVYHCRRRTGFRDTFQQARRYGWSHVELYRRYGRGRVDRRAHIRRALAGWWWLVRATPSLRQSSARTVWAWRAGQSVGRLEGSLRSRTLWL